MLFRAVFTGLLCVLTVAACGAPASPPGSEPTPVSHQRIKLIEGEESAEYERVAQISMLVFGADAKERAVNRARIRAAELGADALSFKLYPVTRPAAPAPAARERHSHAAYSLMPLLRARVSCSLIEGIGHEGSSGKRDDPGSGPDCSELDASLRVYSPIELGRSVGVPVQNRGYILIGWALQHRPDARRSEV